MAVTYRQFRDDLLVAFARKTENEGRNIYELEDLAEEAGLFRRAGWIDMAGRDFADRGYMMDASDTGGPAGALEGPGQEEAERLMEVAERVMELDRSSEQYERVMKALEDLAEAIRSNNEYGAAEPEDKEQRLAEIEAAQRQLKSPRIRVEAFMQLGGRALRYLALKFGEQSIGKAAAEAVERTFKMLFG